MLPAYAAVTLSKVKSYGPWSGTALDAFIEDEIVRWTREVERHVGRRLVYRAPGDDAENDNIVASASYATGPLTVAQQPVTPGRTMIVTFPATATAGTVTVTGTVAGVAAQTEVFDAASVAGGSAIQTQHGVKFFSAISAIAVAAAAGGGNVKVGSSAGYTEFHTPRMYARNPHVLAPRQWPVRQVVDMNEDAACVYAAATALVLGTGYSVDDRQYLVRKDGGLPIAWAVGYRAVRDIYSAGYFTALNVPAEIQSVICELVAWSVRRSTTGRQGTESGSDAAGSFVLSGPPFITDIMAGRLREHKSQDTEPTASWDFDEEAA